MFRLNDQNPPYVDSQGIVSEKYVTVQKAVELTGYNSQYLRRLLRAERLQGIKVGQGWLILFDSIYRHFYRAANSADQRFGPKAIRMDLPFSPINDPWLQAYTHTDQEEYDERDCS